MFQLKKTAPTLTKTFPAILLLMVCIMCGQTPLFALTKKSAETVPGESSVKSEEARLMADVNEQTATTDQRISALDSLSNFDDPELLDFFKEQAFRNQSKELNLAALGMLWKFIYTDRWNEACDTLCDVVRSYQDADCRDSALQTLKITALAFKNGIPFDRNNVIDALLKAIDKDTYIKDARNFFSAVWLLVQISCKEDIHVIKMLEYLRENFATVYKLDDLQSATYAYQSFKNSIAKTYIDDIGKHVAPQLISDIRVDSTSVLSISVVAYMLDSSVTDSLGFAALAWLAVHGANETGIESQRLLYLYNHLEHKRPDKSAELSVAFQPVLARFGVRTVFPEYHIISKTNHHPWLRATNGGVLVEGLTGGETVRCFNPAGRLLYRCTALDESLLIGGLRWSSLSTSIVTVDNQIISHGKKK